MTVDPTTPSEIGRLPLSVVIIAENEEARIRQCIQSVFEACRAVEAFEVILVDSSSTDRTVERALEYPITVLRIPEEHTVSCGAGRYVGDRIASGEMVLHVDGDMTLTERLREPDVAAVEGCLDRSTQDEIREVDKVGGVMLYDAAALRDIGGFDPYLLGYEDVDVGFRLRDAGYRLLRLPTVSAVHHDDGAVTESFRRWRQGYLIAPGQTIRKWAGSPTILWRLIRRQRYELGVLAWVCAGAVAAISTPLAVGWLLLSALGVGVVTSRLGVRGAIDFFMAKCFGLVGLAVGLRHRTRAAETYPVNAVEVVAEGPVHGRTGDGRPAG